MAPIDARTALTISGTLYVVLPVVAWLLVNDRRSLAVNLWCIGGLFTGIGISLTALRQVEFGPLYPVTASSLILVATILRMQSLRLDLGNPLSAQMLISASVIGSGITFALEVPMGMPVVRAQFNTLLIVVMVVDIAIHAWRIGKREGSRSAYWIAWVYLLSGAVMSYRAFALTKLGDKPVLIFLEGGAAQSLALILLLSSVIGHFGYVGMVLDRAKRREMEAVAQRTRADEQRRLSEELARGERVRAMDGTAALLGHELRQPLTAILANAQLAEKGLQTGRLDAGQLAGILEKVVRNTRRADQIVERVRGLLKPSPAGNSPVDLHAVAADVLGLLADEAESAGVDLQLAESEGPVRAAGDALQLSQALMNMLRNALQATAQSERRTVRVVVRREGEQALVEVQDSGPGLPEGHSDRLGSAFFTTRPDGLGLGLVIARDIARQHLGQVHLTNSPAGGALAVLSLPALVHGA